MLLHFGVSHLWLRYGCAVSVAYIAFLGLLWCWLHLRGDSLNGCPDFPGSSSSGSSGSCNAQDVSFSSGGGEFGGGGASGSFDADATSIPFVSDGGTFSSNATPSIPDVGLLDSVDAGEALPLVALLGALVGVIALLGAIFASAWIVWSAPTFLGELVVDVALARGLYKQMAGSFDSNWLGTALQHTFWSFVGLLLLLMIAGALMQAAVPNIESLGQFIHYFSGAH